MKNERPSIEQFRKKALQNADIKAEYDSLAPVFEMKRKMIAMRKEAGLTQEQMAELLCTKKSNISRLESVSSDVSPRLSTLEQYARALGHTIRVDFEPDGLSTQ